MTKGKLFVLIKDKPYGRHTSSVVPIVVLLRCSD
nr:MAG TPA: hypothetical protein [Caudoviricetes sp.]